MSIKGILHPRNRHQGQYDFNELMRVTPELKAYVKANHVGISSIDFGNPNGVKMLNRALLKKFYGIELWDIPENYLCPPVPGRADYLHYAADLLADQYGGKIPTGEAIRILDIGVGANCIYPIIGVAEYGWSFVGSDIDSGALRSAQKILDHNPQLKKNVELRFQKNSAHIFKGMVKPQEHFHLTICNPPFHESKQAAEEVNARKWRNLGKAAVANFGGQNNELWCEGGEVAFISKMVLESREMPGSALWYSSFVSKEASLGPLYGVLRQVRASIWKTVEMSQGQKKGRFIAWSFV